MKKPKQLEKGARGLSRAEQVAVIGGVKVLQDGAITDEEYADWSVPIKDQTMK